MTATKQKIIITFLAHKNAHISLLKQLKGSRTNENVATRGIQFCMYIQAN